MYKMSRGLRQIWKLGKTFTKILQHLQFTKISVERNKQMLKLGKTIYKITMNTSREYRIRKIQ